MRAKNRCPAATQKLLKAKNPKRLQKRNGLARYLQAWRYRAIRRDRGGFIAGFHVSRGLQRALGVAGGLGGRCGCVCVLGGRQPSRSGGWRRAVRLSASRCAVRVVVVSVVVHVLRCADCRRARLRWQAAPALQRGAAPRLQRSSGGCSCSCRSSAPWMPHSRLVAPVSSSGGV